MSSAHVAQPLSLKGRMSQSTGLLYAFGYTISWAIAGVLLRSLSQRMDPFLIVGIRAIVGTLVIVPLALLTGWDELSLLTPGRLVYLIGSVIIGGVIGSTCSVYGFRVLGLQRALPITNASPIFSYLFSWLLLGEGVRWVVVPGTALTLLGVYLIGRSREGAVASDRALTTREWVLGIGASAAAAVRCRWPR